VSDWQQTDLGIGRQVRSRWRRDTGSPQPSLDTLTTLDQKADKLRLVDAMLQKNVSERDQKYVRRTLQIMLVVAVLGQRLAIPLGDSPVFLILFVPYIGILALRLRGGVRYNRVRTELYIAGAAAVVAATWFSTFLGRQSSLPSLWLLLILYLPWVFCVSRQFLDQMPHVMRTFVWLMMILGLIGDGQMLAQLLGGWTYTDFLQNIVGENLIAQGFNTANQISYTNTVIKANAFVFLEPSFLSQFLALALIVSLLIKAPAWQPLVLGLGMAGTLSGTGILLLVVGIAMMTVLVPNRIRPSYVIAGIVGLAIVFATPAANILLERRTETSQSGSSGSLRFVQPYQEVGQGLAEDPSRYLIGAGAGSSERLLESDRNHKGEAVVYTIPTKLAFEYGLPAAVLFVAFLMVSILRGPPLPVLPTCVIFMIFFLSGSLLQPNTIILAWLVTSIWGPPVTVGVSDAMAALRRLRNGPANPEPTTLT
jgi:hypothetical protein